MINVNELRIGNIVVYSQDDDEMPVLKIDGDSKTVCLDMLLGYNMEVDEQEIDPIPLTPEWLERCGFENGKLNGVTIGYDGDDFIHAQFSVPYNGQMLKVKHLHQLQNLYFALTGEELQIKLP